jgi:hypothetical protein
MAWSFFFGCKKLNIYQATRIFESPVVLAAITTMHKDLERLAQLVLTSIHALTFPFLQDMGSAIAEFGNRLSDLFEIWEQEIGLPVTNETRYQFLAAAREAKKEKQAHRCAVTQTHIHILLANTLSCTVVDPLFERDRSTCNINPSLFLPDLNEELTDERENSIHEPGIACLMELFERYREGNPRAEHSDLVIKIGFILSSYRSTGYDLLHQLFGFPTLVSIWRHFHKEIDALSSEMTDPEFMRQRLLDFRPQYHLNNSEEVHAIMAVDACSILTEKKFDITNQPYFLFPIISLNATHKSFLVRLRPFPHRSPIRQFNVSLTKFLVCWKNATVSFILLPQTAILAIHHVIEHTSCMGSVHIFEISGVQCSPHSVPLLKSLLSLEICRFWISFICPKNFGRSALTTRRA